MNPYDFKDYSGYLFMLVNIQETPHATYEEVSEMKSLLDGVYEIVELFKPETPAQIKWKQEWLQKVSAIIPQVM